jgi:hypothetical protein
MAEVVQNEETVEEWRVVKDYPNYEVSNMGLIRRNGKTIFKGSKTLCGYIRVCLSNNGKADKFHIHRLVAEAFIPNPENKSQVNHLGEKDDNRVCMLEWATPSENSLHGAQKNRMHKNNQIISIAKVNKDTDEIIKIYSSIIDIENDGYTYRKVYKCIKGQNHTHLGFVWKKHNIENIIASNSNSNSNLEGEIWRSLKDSIYDEVNIFTNHEVSNYGRVKGFYGKILSPNKITGIEVVQLKANNQVKYMRVHRLVLMGFNIEKPNANMNEVDHINSVNTDNRLENLRWADRNIQVNNPNTKVKKLMKIKFMKDGVETIYTKGIRELAKEIKICVPVIYKYIVLKKEYKGYIFEMLDEELETRNTRKRNELLNIDKKDINIQKIFKVKVIHNNEEFIYNSLKQAKLCTKCSYYKMKQYAQSGEEFKGYRFEILNDK